MNNNHTAYQPNPREQKQLEKEKKYILVGQEKQTRFDLCHADGSIDQYNYHDLHGLRIDEHGTTITLHVTYAPLWVCHGRNLHKLAEGLREQRIPVLCIFKEGFHDAQDGNAAVITNIAPLEVNEDKKTDVS